LKLLRKGRRTMTQPKCPLYDQCKITGINCNDRNHLECGFYKNAMKEKPNGELTEETTKPLIYE
jgi:hypothetical protein